MGAEDDGVKRGGRRLGRGHDGGGRGVCPARSRTQAWSELCAQYARDFKRELDDKRRRVDAFDAGIRSAAGGRRLGVETIAGSRPRRNCGSVRAEAGGGVRGGDVGVRGDETTARGAAGGGEAGRGGGETVQGRAAGSAGEQRARRRGSGGDAGESGEPDPSRPDVPNHRRTSFPACRSRGRTDRTALRRNLDSVVQTRRRLVDSGKKVRNFCQRLSTGPNLQLAPAAWQNLHNACAIGRFRIGRFSLLQLARKYLARGIRSGRTRRVGRFPATPTCPFVASSPPSVSRSVESTRESISRGRVAAPLIQLNLTKSASFQKTGNFPSIMYQYSVSGPWTARGSPWTQELTRRRAKQTRKRYQTTVTSIVGWRSSNPGEEGQARRATFGASLAHPTRTAKATFADSVAVPLPRTR